MALIDATVAGSAANSYCTLAEALAYWASSPEGGKLLAESQANQEKWLLVAASFLEARIRWPGDRTILAQRLKLPRTDLEYDGIGIGSMVIPAPAKYAQAEMASVLYQRDIDPDEAKAPGISSLSVESISISFAEPDPSKAPAEVPSSVLAWLRQLGAGESGGNSFAVLR